MFKTNFFFIAVLFLSFSLLGKKVFAQDTTWTSMVTDQVGLDSTGAFAVYTVDINNDGYPDLVTLREGWSVSAENMVRVYINVQDTSSNDPKKRMFLNITDSSGVNAMPDTNISTSVLLVAFADINNDGNVDMVRGNYYHDKPENNKGDRCEVLLGDGTGKFTLAPNNGLHELGLMNTTGFSFLDYDKDGNIDLFIGLWFTTYATNDQIWSPGYLMRGKGDGTFENVSRQAGINQREPMYGTSVVDWNNDGWPDIMTAPYCRTGGQLWRNNKDGTFTNVAKEVGYNAQKMGGDNGQALCMWSSVPEDFDNDGDMDMFFALVHGGNDRGEGRSTIVVNRGDTGDYKLDWDLDRITWKRPQSSHRGDYDASWLDWDNDGLMDLAVAQGTYMPNSDRLFILHQDSSHHFTDITYDIGLLRDDAKNLHLLEAFDFDLDGDDDLVFSRLNNDAPKQQLQIVENKIGQDNNWLGVRLNAAPGVNKSSIGARIYLWSGGVQRMREVYAGRGNSSGQQPFAMLFGLGQNQKVDSVMVKWPNKTGSVTIVKNPTINQYIEIGPDTTDVPKDNNSSIKNTENNLKSQLKVYPNPAKDFVLVQFENGMIPEDIEIYNSIGQKMKNIKVYHQKSSTQLCMIQDLPVGLYILKAKDKHQKTFTQTFLKNR